MPDPRGRSGLRPRRCRLGRPVVAVFPEGTTSCGAGASGFRPAFFQAAVDAGAPVVPVALRFEVAGEPTAQPAFIGDDTLLDSLRRVLALGGLRVEARVGAPIHPGPAASRRSLARIAGAGIVISRCIVLA